MNEEQLDGAFQDYYLRKCVLNRAKQLLDFAVNDITRSEIQGGICRALFCSWVVDISDKIYWIPYDLCAEQKILCHFVGKIAANWPKYSGHPEFPVPHEDSQYPEEAFYDHRSDRWNIMTQYGRDRMELLQFMITELERIIAEQETEEQ